MAKNKKEILSSCCAFGGGSQEVYVLKEECPISREEGQRVVRNLREERHECTCVNYSSLGTWVSPCQHYKGIKKVQRKGLTEFQVLCSALEEETE
jgi:hypothetical protein